MRNWQLHDAVEWLLQKCRDKKAADPKNPDVTVSLTGPGSDSEPPGELIREAINWARNEAFCSIPRGFVRIRGNGNPEKDNAVSICITQEGEGSLQRREEYKEASPGVEA